MSRASGLLVVVGFAAACGAVLALGFDHVSDDDYARVTIAQAFAHAPRLDPSGTSWLPFPFWALGSALAVLGRSLGVARVASVGLASVATLLPYHALRVVGVPERRALVALAFALLTPWSLWLGAATVPESFTASATAAAAIALTAEATSTRARFGFAVALLAACLSRYEPWPIAALLGLVLAARAVRTRSGTTAATAALVVLGPLAWLLWNAHAHGDALHFFARVSRFKQALGTGSTDAVSAVLLYPRLLVLARPDVVLALCLATAATRTAWPSVGAALRTRWSVPVACAAAQLAFLAYGNARDGAPAHHAERALLAIMLLLAMLAVDALGASFGSGSRVARRIDALGGALVAIAWIATTVHAFGDVPGSGSSDDRATQRARGRALRDEHVTALVITPCAYEHFALIAAYQAPEAVEILPSTHEPVEPGCPAVERR